MQAIPSAAARLCRTVIAAIAFALLASCGGSGEPVAATPAEAVSALRAQARTLVRKAIPLPDLVDQLFAYAETHLPTIFYGASVTDTRTVEGAIVKLRIYTQTGTVLAVVLDAGSSPYTAGNVYVIGGPFTSLLDAGPIGTYVQEADPNGETTPATVNAALAGTRTLRFAQSAGLGCGSACAFTEGQSVSVTISADSKLTIGNRTLSNPFFRHYGGPAHQPEIIWLDAVANVEYALTDNTSGDFSEINVGDAARPGSLGMPAFLGQLRPIPPTPTVFGTHSIAWQYTGATVPWTSVTIGEDATITFNGGPGPNVTAANRVGISNFVGCCGRYNIEVSNDISGDGVGGDQIYVMLGADGGIHSIEYPVGNGGDASRNIGVRLGPAAALAHDGTAVPAGNAIHGTLGASVLNLDGNMAFSRSEQSLSMSAEPVAFGPTWLIQIQPGAPLQQGMTYECRRTATTNVMINARSTTNGPLRTTSYGGRCSITLTKLVTSGGQITEVEGTFAAEINDAKYSVGATVTNGVFRYKH